MDRNVTQLPQSPRMPITAPVGPRDRRWYWMSMGFIAGLVVGVLVSWAFAAFRSQESPVATITPSPTATVTSTPRLSPSPSPTVNPADWTFEVLNGSGVAGAAAKAADVLKERGYTVAHVGNAEESTTQKTELLVSSQRAEEAPALLADLKQAGFPVTEFDATLDSTTLTARLIIGKDWNAPSTSPSSSSKISPTPRSSAAHTPTPKP